MSNYSGYITDVEELYVFARNIDAFCTEFKNGCYSIASSFETDYGHGLRQIQRIRQWCKEKESQLSYAKREYEEYTSQEEYDQSRTRYLKEEINMAQEAVARAREELGLAEHLFYQLRMELDNIRNVASGYGNEINGLGTQASNIIREAAHFISTVYNK